MVYLTHGTRRRRRCLLSIDWFLIFLLVVNLALLALLLVGLAEVIRWIS